MDACDTRSSSTIMLSPPCAVIACFSAAALAAFRVVSTTKKPSWANFWAMAPPTPQRTPTGRSLSSSTFPCASWVLRPSACHLEVAPTTTATGLRVEFIADSLPLDVDCSPWPHGTRACLGYAVYVLRMGSRAQSWPRATHRRTDTSSSYALPSGSAVPCRLRLSLWRRPIITQMPASRSRTPPVTEGRLPWMLGGNFSASSPPCSCYARGARALGCRACEDHAACEWTRHRHGGVGMTLEELLDHAIAMFQRYGARRRGEELSQEECAYDAAGEARGCPRG